MSASFNGDPLSAARSPQPRLSTLYARAFADDRDPLLLLRRPPENLHASTNMQSLAESHVNSSHELERFSYLSQAGWGSLLESTHMDGTQMYGASRLLDASGFTDTTVLGEPSKDEEIAALKAEIAALKRGVTLEDEKWRGEGSSPQRVANAVGQESQQNQSWKMLKQSVGLLHAKQEQPSVGARAPGAQQCASLSPAQERPLSPAQERPYAVPKGGVRFDASTGQVAEGFNVGEVPLPGAAMTEDECRRFGLPLGSKWVNNEAVKNPISPLQDPNIHKIHWNELPVISAPIGVVKPGTADPRSSCPSWRKFVLTTCLSAQVPRRVRTLEPVACRRCLLTLCRSPQRTAAERHLKNTFRIWRVPTESNCTGWWRKPCNVTW